MPALTRLSIDPGRIPAAGGSPSSPQAQTRDAFGFKWGQRHSYESGPVKEATREWLFQRYCGGDPSRLDGWLAGGRKIILDAGCGSGFSSLLFFGERLAGLSDAEAWEALYPLTKLGVALGELATEIEVPEDVPLLGIRKGRLDLQRFFYWNVCKLYYRPDWTLEEMNHVNFDWFRPLNCHRQTPEEVEAWVREAGLGLERMDVQEAGITVVARREG